ncbi:conserved hypothetical protein [Histoplasma capsulatum var. duboisii H88]|uniref:Reverse transcriptase domain-containing protein n=1 Tax=Ajellomyces capsulatus (strain H88) TaxID=544711 RepID=F0USL2_AJEC8|nr:conserved hypothetical protein [Histoplasma capsulatum var. duboisii H88]QSS54488.1 hypothetical protein I7I53_02050 [Histoplasma capsulatum var. duboisii H88]
MASSSILSQTLQSITVTKIQELETKRQAYQQHKDNLLANVESARENIRERVTRLHDGMKEMNIWPVWEENMVQLSHIKHWVHQSAYDPSVNEDMLRKFEQQMRAKLDAESRKLDLAHLYSRLLIEWIDAPKSANEDFSSFSSTKSERPLEEDSFEVIQNIQKEKLQQLRDKFEAVVLTPLETDAVEIDNYLNGLFSSKDGQASLDFLRKRVKREGEIMLYNKTLFDRQSLHWCIESLLKVDLFDDEKQASLRDFLKDDDVLNEIKDVLNMRFANIQNWSWGLGDQGMPVVPRQKANGKWRVMMDDDVLQAIFTHWIGTNWAIQLKTFLQGVQNNPKVWKNNFRIPQEDRAKRRYYLNCNDHSGSEGGANAEQDRQETYREHFFLAPLPSKFYEESGGYDDDDDGDDASENGKGGRLNPKEIKQLLLRTLATEFLVRRSLDGEAAVVQSDFQWFATGLAHSSVFAVLRFMGFQEEWISFFKKVLEPPLDMLNGKPVRTRKRGLPMSHIFEKFMGEMVLFFMDLTVNQHTGMILYRFHDDLWLCGKPDRCAKAWQIMEEFAKVMGLEFNKSKTGSVYFVEEQQPKNPEIVKVLPEGPVVINFMVLDPKSGSWVINQEHVLEHAKQLRKQLAGCKSVLEWIKTWNSCIGRFFSHTFADPAHCFGRSHIKNTLETHKRIQSYLFSDLEGAKTVADYLSNTISTRFNPSVPVTDAFLYLPETLGGLGLLNPFTPLLLVSENFHTDTEDHIRKFHQEERDNYEQAKQKFLSLNEHQRRRRYNSCFKDENDISFGDDDASTTVLPWKPQAQTFFSFDEYVRWRECSSHPLWMLRKELMYTPLKMPITYQSRVYKALCAVAESYEASDGDPGRTGGRRRRFRPERGGQVSRGGLPDIHPNAISKEHGWTISFYADEVFEAFGGLELLDRKLLPLGVLKVMRSRMVTWQMVL